MTLRVRRHHRITIISTSQNLHHSRKLNIRHSTHTHTLRRTRVIHPITRNRRIIQNRTTPNSSIIRHLSLNLTPRSKRHSPTNRPTPVIQRRRINTLLIGTRPLNSQTNRINRPTQSRHHPNTLHLRHNSRHTPTTNRNSPTIRRLNRRQVKGPLRRNSTLSRHLIGIRLTIRNPHHSHNST